MLLGASAARSCPVKTHNAFDPTVPAPVDGPEELPARVQAARAFEAQQLEALIERHKPDELILTGNIFDPEARQRSFRLTAEAMGLV